MDVRTMCIACLLCLNVVHKASKSLSRPDMSSQGMMKVGSEANIASMSGVTTSSNHSSSAVNLAMTTSTPSLTMRSNDAATTPTVTVTNLVAVITDVQSLVTWVIIFLLSIHIVGWGTGIRGLMRGMATLPQGNQELLVVRDKVGRPQVSLG